MSGIICPWACQQNLFRKDLYHRNHLLFLNCPHLPRAKTSLSSLGHEFQKRRARLHTDFNASSAAKFEVVSLNSQHGFEIPPLSILSHHLPPPLSPSPHADGAEQIIMRLAEGWGMTPAGLKGFQSVNDLAIFMSTCIFPSCVSADRLAAVSLVNTIIFILDDICFDNASIEGTEPEDFGINSSVLQDSSQLKNFWERLNAIFRLPELPADVGAIERAYWDAAQLIKRHSCSNEWFDYMADAWEDYFTSTLDRDEDLFRSGKKKFMEDIDTYMEMALRNSGMHATCVLMELANDMFLPTEFRSHPQIQRLMELCMRNGSRSNSLFSYYKEVHVEKRPSGNIIQVMMDTQGISFEQAVRGVMDSIVANNFEFVQIETNLQVLDSDPENMKLLSMYAQSLKEMAAGAIEFQLRHRRYRAVDSPFPELRNLSDC